MASQLVTQKAPYFPQDWALGGRPEADVDIPITSVFLALFFGSAACHMTIFRLNTRRGHKFLFSGVLFGFSMARIVTCVLRIAGICIPKNARLAIATAIFVGAGILIIFIVNLLWAQRILRALHPTIGWHRATSILFNTLYVIVFFTFLSNIITIVQTFYTLRPRTLFIDRALQLYGSTMLAIVSSIPIIVVLLALAVPRHNRPERFGAGTLSSKVVILLIGSALVTIGAWYRCGTLWMTPVPKSRPLPGYFSRPYFYIFNFGVEILTLYFYAIMRVDLEFHIPDGAKGPGSYEPRQSANYSNGEKSDSSSMEAFRMKLERFSWETLPLS